MVIPMNKKWEIIVWCAILAFFPLGCQSEQPDVPQPETNDPALVAACNWIEGGGMNTTGGKGGKVYVVTTLSDELDEEGYIDSGSLRYAVEEAGARTIIFQVAGVIHLVKPLVIENGNLTIAGQTAPGDGICIADYPIQIKKADNVIIRFLRIRLGDESNTEYDAVSVNDSKGVVLDHLSCSWSVDECVSCYGNTDFTMQYCFITESLKNSVHGKGSHGYGGIWGGKNASFHHNLLAHHDSRNPRFDHDYVDSKCAGPIDFVNNVVYNWGGNSAYGGEGASKGAGGRHINFVNNYYKPGPATKSGVKNRLLNPTTKCGNCSKTPGGTVEPGKFYVTDNVMFGSSDVTADNWKGVFPDESAKLSQCKTESRWTDGLIMLANEQTAEQAYETVLTKAGCSLVRDAIDSRIANEVRNGTSTCKGSNGSTGGLIDTQSDAGGWPEYGGTKSPDSDGDGIPDSWEEEHGLNPKRYSDGRTSTLVNGYSNLEVYINAIVAHLY